MKKNYIYEGLLFVVLIVVQVLIFNQISIVGFATPFVYSYFILKLPVGRNVFYVIIMGFLLGLIIDIFLNTPGINATATTIIATFRQSLLQLFFTKEDTEDFKPSIYTAPFSFIKYTAVTITIHIAIVLLLDSLSLFNLHILLIRWISSTLLTFFIVLGLDAFIYKIENANE